MIKIDKLSKKYDKDYVFATVETLNKDAHLQQYKVDDFDCIILVTTTKHCERK